MPIARPNNEINSPVWQALGAMQREADIFGNNINAIPSAPIWIRGLTVDLQDNNLAFTYTLRARVLYAERYSGLVDNGFHVAIQLDLSDPARDLRSMYMQAWSCLKEHIVYTLRERTLGDRLRRRGSERHVHRMAHRLPPVVTAHQYSPGDTVRWQRVPDTMVISTMEPVR